MFKEKIFLLVLQILALNAFGQTDHSLKGEISFVSSRNVYVKFSSTDGIEVGDTLMVQTEKGWIKGLLVNSKSSTSTVTTPLFESSSSFFKGQNVSFEKKIEEKIDVYTDTIIPITENIAEEDQILVNSDIIPEEKTKKNEIKGSLALGSYSNFNDYRESHRFRYALILNGNSFANNKLSFENYITFRYSSQNWEQIKENLFTGIRIFNSSMQYQISPGSSISLGRKINRKFSNMGAVDGLQFEKNWNRFFLGTILGSRPNLSTYGLDLSLMQFGVFGGFKSNQNISTIAFVEQKNKMATDRRFFFMQYSGNIKNKLFVFSSFEIDLYKKIQDEIINKPQLTNLFISANTSFSRFIRFSASYDNRRNIIFYESYKNHIDQLIDEETRQGLRAGINVRFLKQFNLSGNINYRFQKSGTNDSKNANLIMNWSGPWGSGSSVSFTTSYLLTNYLKSNVIGLRIRQTILKGKLDGDAYVRRVNYNYLTREINNFQTFLGINLNYILTKKMGLYVYGEVVLDEQTNKLEKRLNTRIIKRF